MKVNEAPEKIYLSDFTDTTEFVFYVKQNNTKKTDIEYTRTDAFVEKALRWMISKGGINDALSREMIEDFKKYMKGE